MTKHNKYQTQRIKYQKKLATHARELAFGLFILAVVLIFQPASAHAATINVATGSSATNDNDTICQLEEAIGNINSGARTYVDCVEAGAYGTNDTINLPAGTITGPGSGVSIGSKSIKIIGQGKNSSTVSDLGFSLAGSGLYSALFKDFKMENYGIESGSSHDLTVDSMEFDSGSSSGFAVAAAGDLTIKDSYLHGVDMSGSGLPMVMATAMGRNIDVVIERSTLYGNATGLGLYAGSGYTTTATIKNSTFTGMRGNSDMNPASGIMVATMSDSTTDYTTINNTFSDMSNIAGSGSSLPAAIREYTADASAVIHHTAQNDLYAVGDGSDAVNYDFSGSGTLGTFTTTSNGGNISSDNSFASKLTQSTDKHNQTALADFLGVLTDNGGKVPTLALEDGSPAINAGTNVSGMTTDARGASRPQGGAFDAGAYELAFNDGGNNSSNNSTTTTNPTLCSPSSSVSQFSLKPITITTPTGTTITSSDTVTEASLGAQDSDYQYPLGLVNFSFTTSQTDNQVTLTFVTDLKPDQVKPRKYNPTTKAYTDITDYTLTETTVDGQHALVLTYTITDNGALDLDPATGVISDPVGLAMTNDSYGQLADTGQSETLLSIVGAGLLAFGAGAWALLRRLHR